MVQVATPGTCTLPLTGSIAGCTTNGRGKMKIGDCAFFTALLVIAAIVITVVLGTDIATALVEVSDVPTVPEGSP